MSGKGPLVRVDFHQRDARVTVLDQDRQQNPPPDRSGTSLDVFSEDSMARLIWTANNAAVTWRSLLTVTYPGSPESWPRNQKTSKKHLAALLQWLRRHYGMRWYLWVREYQERYAPHYHILTDVELFWDGPCDRKMVYRNEKGESWGSRLCHARVSSEWQHIIGPYASEDGYKAGCRWEALKSARGGAAYLATYYGKAEQKTTPPMTYNGGRWWGGSQNLPGVSMPDYSVTIPAAEYLRLMEGELKNEAGYLYSVVHDGRRRGADLLPDTSGGDLPRDARVSKRHPRK